MENNLNNNDENFIFHMGESIFNYQNKTLITNNEIPKNLSYKETEILRLLINVNDDNIITKEYILKEIWGYSLIHDDLSIINIYRSIDVYINKLRNHFKNDKYIEIINIHGKGFWIKDSSK